MELERLGKYTMPGIGFGTLGTVGDEGCALVEAAPFLGDIEGATLWEARFQAAMKALQDADDRGTWSGAVMQIRTDTSNP